VEPNGPGSNPGGSGFFSQPIRVFPTPPQSRGFNNPFSQEGVWWAGSPIVKVLRYATLRYATCFGKYCFVVCLNDCIDESHIDLK
jgi:hypothetical protein